MKQKIFAVLTIAALLLGSAIVAKTAVSTIAGLAVAQSSTVWNSIKDAAVGDALTNGVLASQLYMYNGTTFDRARGDTTFGLDVDVTRLPGGGQTPADGFANPSTFLGAWSLNGLWNGTTWDRAQTANSDAQTLGINASGLMGFNNTNWTRLRAIGGQLETLAVQSRTGTVTTESVSAVATPVVITITGVAGTYAHVNGIDAFCSAGTASITVTRTTGTTLIWSTPTTAIGTTLFSKEFPVPLTSTVLGDSITVTLSSCGGGNTGALMVRGGLSI